MLVQTFVRFRMDSDGFEEALLWGKDRLPTPEEKYVLVRFALKRGVRPSRFATRVKIVLCIVLACFRRHIMEPGL